MLTSDPCKLLLVDDHALFRDSLKLAFGPIPGLLVVGEASGAGDACEMASSAHPDVALLDLKLRDGDGLSLIGELRRRVPDLRVLVVSMVDDPSRVAEAFEAGAAGYATKDESFEALARAIHDVRKGSSYLSSRLSRTEIEMWRKRAPARDSLAVLTRREREVFELVVQGLTSAQIGDRLGTSPRTVETHRIRILSKLHAKSVLDLARIAAQRGLLKGWN